MELKVNGSGAVDFILLTNGTRVKNQMTVREAKELIQRGKISKKGNQITVDDKFVFEVEGSEPVAEPVAEPVEAPVEDKPLKEAVKEASAKKKPRKKAKK